VLPPLLSHSPVHLPPAAQICRPAGVPVIINDRIDVAIASGADGVHIGQSDLPARVARALLGPHALLGVSVKTPAEAAKARADGADYVGVGAVFPTGTKDASVIGLEGLAAAVAGGALPAVAIGGVGAANAAQVCVCVCVCVRVHMHAFA
jgi:hydroxymethylpyrimidine kinase / phosphomethylpyrimidine kinase / thiamine-phosphate diphosphorylase